MMSINDKLNSALPQSATDRTPSTPHHLTNAGAQLQLLALLGEGIIRIARNHLCRHLLVQPIATDLPLHKPKPTKGNCCRKP
ncbi:Protein of unknown function [Pyronema omphalodes CBS 100304]|uniref:Uncharacterized protein n=1 Tax=Pyronema omphalodes (strain CBS 100304) TaxID=1076935 RepID=U4LV19_PYROM|nr:Protein of unknown function [Pyronema omphalodes CBS 100304]